MSVKSKSIQEKTAELNELVAWFDGDDFVLETALEKFKDAEKLAGEIETDLRAVQNEIQIVKQKFDADIA
ncbi:exodeoxyribonuclease VII small subunit [Candidatus Saccharibacteria bacterium]|nr:exodeoxyribonuclease VII small subunit [Candidatus Saccharibacteria bacterium]